MGPEGMSPPRQGPGAPNHPGKAPKAVRLIGDGSTSATGPQPHQPTAERLEPGEKPPQFVVFSWDGTGQGCALRLLQAAGRLAGRAEPPRSGEAASAGCRDAAVGRRLEALSGRGVGRSPDARAPHAYG
ncbi:hypothetical protein GTZ78_03440 [Streptomyces sp. SID8361]|nr:hypothetical protein [Streptomyces sp. SID8361]